MDFSKLSQGAKIALIAGAVLVIDLFLPWISVGVLGFKATGNAFSSGFIGWFGAVLAIAGAVVLLLKAMGTTEVNAGNFKTEQLAVIGGGLGFIFIVLRWLTYPTGAGAGFGLYLGIIAAAAVTYGAFMTMKAAGEKLPGMG